MSSHFESPAPPRGSATQPIPRQRHFEIPRVIEMTRGVADLPQRERVALSLLLRSERGEDEHR